MIRPLLPNGCVCGFNFFSLQNHHVQLTYFSFMHIISLSLQVKELTTTEDILIRKKNEMSKFQVEYTEAVKKYKEVVEKLKNETEEINSLLKVRNS